MTVAAVPSPEGDVLDEGRFAVDVSLLGMRHPELAAVLDRWGEPALWCRPPGFASLVLLVLEQRVSLASARAVYRRLVGILGEVTPAAVLAAGESAVRAVGVSGRKVGYLQGLAGAVTSGTLDLDALPAMGDDAARSALTAQRGLGPWTADVYLLGCLLRRDVWPAGDRALAVAAGRCLGLAATPGAQAMVEIGERWRPRRSTAARLLWHAYLEGRELPSPLSVEVNGRAVSSQPLRPPQ